MEEMNPVYLEYCRHQGNAPEAQKAVDVERYPGGKMAGFIAWAIIKAGEYRRHLGLGRWDNIGYKEGYLEWLRSLEVQK